MQRGFDDLTRPVSVPWSAAILALALLVHAGQVRAQGEDYKALTNAAIEEHSLGHYQEARALFARAHEIAPSARTLWGMGIAAFEGRDYVDAIRLLSEAREDPRKPLTPAQRKEADSLLSRSQAYVVRLPLRIQPASAVVTIDGRAVASESDGSVLLDAGTHQVVVAAPGHEEIVRSLRLEAGRASPLEVRLEAKQENDAIEGQKGPAPVSSSAPVAASAAAAEPARPFKVLKWVSLGATAAALGVMGAGLGLRQSAATDYNNETLCPGPDKDVSCPGQRDVVHKWETMAIVSGATAGVFATLTVVFFVLDRRSSQERPGTASACGPAFTLGVSCVTRF